MRFNGSLRALGACRVGSSPATPTNDGRLDKLVKSSPFQGGVPGALPGFPTK